MLFFNTDLHVKFLIVIILIVLEINLFYRILVSGGWRGGGGGGRGKVVSGSTEFCTFSNCQEKQQFCALVGFHGTLLQSPSIFSLNC